VNGVPFISDTPTQRGDRNSWTPANRYGRVVMWRKARSWLAQLRAAHWQWVNLSFDPPSLYTYELIAEQTLLLLNTLKSKNVWTW
jgi:hypothetical protein